jgi:geranylgeranyl pyrophosphate synthase
MTIKERMLSFATDFNTYFLKRISQALKKQQEFHHVSVDLDTKLEELFHNYAKGGKRIRPFIISYLSGRDLNDPELLSTSLSVELFHLTAVVHDDIIDQSAQRRGVPSIHTAVDHYASYNQRLGEDVALLLGDLFLVDALEEAATLPHDLFTEISTMMQRTVRGQYLDSFGMNEAYGTTDRLVVEARSELKTAWYTFGSPALIGLKLSEQHLTEEEQQKVVDIYVELGILFQIRDDIIDCSDQYGKEPYGDIMENQTTWVTLFIKEHHPKVFTALVEMKEKNRDGIHELLKDISFNEAYEKEYQKRKELIEELKDINIDLYTKSSELLSLLKL